MSVKERKLCQCQGDDVYLTSAERLSKLPVWEKQRIMEPEHVEEIVAFQKDHIMANGRTQFPGIFFTCVHDGSEFVIDGQHRQDGIKKLMSQGHTVGPVIVWKREVSSAQDVIRFFQLINKARPVSIPDMMLDDKAGMVNWVCQEIWKRYPKFFSNCKVGKPRRPNIRMDDMKNEMYTRNVPECLKVKDGRALLAKILNYNDQCAAKPVGYFPPGKMKQETLMQAHQKCKTGGFYLGMYPSFEWIDSLIDREIYQKSSDDKASTPPSGKSDKKESEKHPYKIQKDGRITVHRITRDATPARPPVSSMFALQPRTFTVRK